MEKVYLGDSVYASYDGYYLTLTTENGGDPGNVIFLEPPVLRKLQEYIDKINTARQKLEERIPLL